MNKETQMQKIMDWFYWFLGKDNENTKPIVYVVIFLLFLMLVPIFLFKRGEIIDKDYSNLVKYGKIIHGEIIDFNPYSHIVQMGRTALGSRAYANRGVDVKIICKELDNEIIRENWSYDLRDLYWAGASVDVYYYDKNLWVKLASVNQQNIALELQEKRVEAGSYEPPETFRADSAMNKTSTTLRTR